MEPGTVNAHLLAITNCPVFGCKTLEKISEHFVNFEAAWNASESEFEHVGIQKSRLEIFFAYRKKIQPIQFVELLHKHQISLLTKEGGAYPPLLKTVFDPPFVLFAKGELPSSRMVSIVGSRRATEYGLDTAYTFGKELAAQGITVVSGLAEGIDSAAHEGAMNSGKTVAVLGSGLLGKRVGEQERIEKDILLHGGAIISEFPLFSPGLKHHFPMRNRIIAGMSDALLVVEAALPSGSLITARCAIDEHRDVFAVPGPITSKTSEGTNDLIRQGAFIATSPNDILTSFGITPRKRTTYTPENAEEKLILTALQAGTKHIDELLLEVGIPQTVLNQTLVTLELKSIIKNVGGMRYESCSLLS